MDLKSNTVGWDHMFGETNPRWNGGNSEYPNHAEMKRIRLLKLRRMRAICEICGQPAYKIHHVDEDKSNHNIENLMVVCNECHGKIHSGTPRGNYKKRSFKLVDIAKECNTTPCNVTRCLVKGFIPKTELQTKILDAIRRNSFDDYFLCNWMRESRKENNVI